MKFSLLTFNTQGTPLYSPDLTKRYQKFCELINKESPDIICFEEVSTYYNLFLLKKYLKYPYFIFKPFLHAPRGGLVIVSKIPLVDVRFVNYTITGSLFDISRMQRIIKNGMLIAKIKDTNLTLISTHTFTDFEFDWSPTNKLYGLVKTQNEQIAEKVNQIVDDGQSVILTGDLNVKKNSRLYKYVINETKMTDVFGDASFPTYYNDRFEYKFKGKTSERIDYILYKQNKDKLKVLSRSHLFKDKEKLSNKKLSYLSDHLGLFVSFDLQ